MLHQIAKVHKELIQLPELSSVDVLLLEWNGME